MSGEATSGSAAAGESTGVQVALVLDRDSEPIQGTIAAAGAEPKRFVGWLELAALLEDLARPPR